MARAICLLNLHPDPPHDALQLVHPIPKPHPQPGHVLIRIALRPVNPFDLITIRTRSFLPPHLQDQTVVIGSEGFGIVEQVGEGVTQFVEGQRVTPIVWRYPTGQGTWQDYVVAYERNVIAVPDSVSDEAAAQFCGNPWAVYGLLKDLAVPKGEYILQTAAGSVLGRQLVQLAKHWGIKTINVVRRDEWKHELKALGADEVINSTTEDVLARVKEITGGKLAFGAVDAVGGVLTKTVAASVRDGGNVFVYGALSGFDFTLSIIDLRRKVKVVSWSLFEYVDTEATQMHVAAEVMNLFEGKIITPLAGKKFKLEDFKEAIQESEKEGKGGKVLLVS